jgi:thioredoxin-like negative regulator of GroEL
MIEEIPISALDPRQVKQLEGADKVLNSNPSYAKEIYSAVVKLSPGCLDVRRKLRALQFRLNPNSSKGLSGIFGKVTAAPFMFRGKGDKNPAETINKAEDLIDKSVANVIAHQMLVDAAKNLEMKGTIVFGLETIRQINPKDLNNLKELGDAYLEIGDTEKTIAIGNEIQKINPSDGDAEDLMKRASVAVAMNKGKWEESEDFRTQLKDEAEAQSLEQASKAVNDSKGLEDLIRQAYAKWEEEPENLNHYRQLSEYYHRYGDLENAIAWIQQARKQEAGKADISLEEKERNLTLEYYDDVIDQWEKQYHQNPNDEDTKSSWEDAINNRKTYQKSQLESLVQRYPNDFGYRFELGVLLYEEEDYENCLAHFQLAQKNAKVRLDAILYLGRAYSRKNFHDLAIEQFNLLKSEIQIMDDRKKEAIYELGCCFESMDKGSEAMEEFKLVYSADISFRDVADKINAFYNQTKT